MEILDLKKHENIEKAGTPEKQLQICQGQLDTCNFVYG